jgi:hypothetical protein
MARSVLASELATRTREAVGAENDGHITTPELLRALTSGVSDTWDQLLMHGIGGEGVVKVSFNTVADQLEYPFVSAPISAADFFQVRNVYRISSDGGKIPLKRINPSESWEVRAPKSVTAMQLYYFPAAPVWTTGAESFDGINGWEEHTIQCAAIAIKAKKGDDTGPFRARKREVEMRMAVMANRMRDEAPRVVRRQDRHRRWGYAQRGYAIPYNTGPLYYDIRGANLELYA